MTPLLTYTKHVLLRFGHRRIDLAGILLGTHGERRRRWVGAECCGVWEGCPLASRVGSLGERRELPSGERD